MLPRVLLLTKKAASLRTHSVPHVLEAKQLGTTHVGCQDDEAKLLTCVQLLEAPGLHQLPQCSGQLVGTWQEDVLQDTHMKIRSDVTWSDHISAAPSLTTTRWTLNIRIGQILCHPDMEPINPRSRQHPTFLFGDRMQEAPHAALQKSELLTVHLEEGGLSVQNLEREAVWLLRRPTEPHANKRSFSRGITFPLGHDR